MKILVSLVVGGLAGLATVSLSDRVLVPSTNPARFVWSELWPAPVGGALFGLAGYPLLDARAPTWKFALSAALIGAGGGPVAMDLADYFKREE